MQSVFMFGLYDDIMQTQAYPSQIPTIDAMATLARVVSRRFRHDTALLPAAAIPGLRRAWSSSAVVPRPAKRVNNKDTLHSNNNII